MEKIDKEYPIDFIYTIKLSRQELSTIRDYIYQHYMYHNVDPNTHKENNLLIEINEILKD